MPPIADVAAALRAGEVVAVKGLGGYHLAALASSADAVATLRARKHREDKPFALMAADVAAARRLVELDDAGRRPARRHRPVRSSWPAAGPTRPSPRRSPRASPSSA